MTNTLSFISPRRWNGIVLLLCCACAAPDEDVPLPDADADSVPVQPAPADTVTRPSADTTDADRNAQWTVGMTTRERNVTGVAILRSVRTARHAGYDRIVFDFGTDPIPNYIIEYVDRPVRDCGAGEVVPLAGDAWLAIRFQPAHAHTVEGQPTLPARVFDPGLPNLKQLKLICDFEAHVEWIAALASPMGYFARELAAPNRVIVDVRQPPR